MIDRDMRGSDAAHTVDEFYRQVFRPGEDHVWTATDLDRSVHDGLLLFTGQRFADMLEEGPSTVGCRLDLASGEVQRIAVGRLFRAGPQRQMAYVAGGAAGERLVIATTGDGPGTTIPVDARIEALEWSPDGGTLLLLAADIGADVSGVEGGFALRDATPRSTWLPDVVSTDARDSWRRLYTWTAGDTAPVPLTNPPINIWEASWLGADALVVIASDHHGEGSWYEASLRVLDARTGDERARHRPSEQIGVPSGAPDGRRWTAIEAFCSDRGILCGTAVLGDAHGVRSLDLGGVEATDVRWRDDDRLLFTGVIGPRTVVGEFVVSTGERLELWSSDTLTIAGWHPQAISFGKDLALAVVEGYAQAPAITRFGKGEAVAVADFAPKDKPADFGTMRHLRWQGRDGLEIDGWIVLPAGEHTNLPLLMDIHGGPVSAHRARHAATLRAGPVLVTLGYALLLPNPRGSSGRGQDYARRVKGDMGGEDMHDYLAGIDHLIAEGIVDPARIAVTGTSYGGFMSARLVTATRRFAAAVPISPVANWYSQHFASQIPWFDEAFLDGSPRQPGGLYFERSPVFFAEGATTPTLVLAGGRDKNTPTDQGVEFYGALAQAGVEAALAVYPEDGHSLRGYPAYLDSAARTVEWVQRHLGPARRSH